MHMAFLCAFRLQISGAKTDDLPTGHLVPRLHPAGAKSCQRTDQTLTVVNGDAQAIQPPFLHFQYSTGSKRLGLSIFFTGKIRSVMSPPISHGFILHQRVPGKFPDHLAAHRLGIYRRRHLYFVVHRSILICRRHLCLCVLLRLFSVIRIRRRFILQRRPRQFQLSFLQYILRIHYIPRFTAAAKNHISGQAHR